MIENNDDLVLALRKLNNLIEDLSEVEGNVVDDMYDLIEEIRSYVGY